MYNSFSADAGADMPTGTVKFYSEEKGYGFIVPDDRSSDISSMSACIASGTPPLGSGAKVAYELGQDRKTGKPKAVNVRPA